VVFIVFASVVGAGCLLALVFGAVALNENRRTVALSRYPLVLVSWIIATPFFGLSAFGALMGLSIAADGQSPAGWLGGGLALTAAVACVVAVVMCMRAAKGKYAHGPRIPAILGFGAPIVAVLVLSAANGEGLGLLIAGIAVAASAGVNGLLAVHVNRRHRLLALSPDATPPAPDAYVLPSGAE